MTVSDPNDLARLVLEAELERRSKGADDLDEDTKDRLRRASEECGVPSQLRSDRTRGPGDGS